MQSCNKATLNMNEFFQNKRDREIEIYTERDIVLRHSSSLFLCALFNG